MVMVGVLVSIVVLCLCAPLTHDVAHRRSSRTRRHDDRQRQRVR
jgi:hypothetical protein